ncbi:MAG: hypothetical protein K2Y37_06120, partial [Pirellulales bacterium]|nr:hypothetical protein [Pirellulales bacterium]
MPGSLAASNRLFYAILRALRSMNPEGKPGWYHLPAAIGARQPWRWSLQPRVTLLTQGLRDSTSRLCFDPS